MPTTYAHWRFGDQCLKTLPNNLQEIILKNRPIFDYGVHGPDIFFYYKCIKHNEVNAFGNKLHDIPFGEILTQMRSLYKNSIDKDAALAYLLGFTSHFTLDSYCHGYVECKVAKSGYTHARVETEFDRFLLLEDMYNPIKKSVTFALKPTWHMAEVIRELFPVWDTKTIYRTITDQLFYLNMIKDSNKAKRVFLQRIMDSVGASYFKDLLMTENEYPELVDSNYRLFKLFNKALEHYKELALAVFDFLEHDKELPSYFNYHFNPKPGYLDIPVLSVEEEKNYQVERQD